MNHADQMDKDMQKCVDACSEAHSTCEETISYCLRKGGQYTESQLMRTLMDCSDITRVCADMCMRMSDMSAEMAAMCARICDMCAEACMRMPDDTQMKRCAEMCRACAQACRAMTGTKAGATG